MPSPLEQISPEVQSIIGADFQTRIPEPVCRALHLNPHDRLLYRIESDGRVRLEKMGLSATARRGELPPLLGLVTGLMAGELGGQGARLRMLDPGLMNSLQELMNSATTPFDKNAKSSDETGSG
ncbi:MAG: type II toxin-antitoxin system PrlF family antitoxin [Panacagrimonas sp.]